MHKRSTMIKKRSTRRRSSMGNLIKARSKLPSLLSGNRGSFFSQSQKRLGQPGEEKQQEMNDGNADDAQYQVTNSRGVVLKSELPPHVVSPHGACCNCLVWFKFCPDKPLGGLIATNLRVHVVHPGGQLDCHGIMPGYRIFAVGDQNITNLGDLKSILLRLQLSFAAIDAEESESALAAAGTAQLTPKAERSEYMACVTVRTHILPSPPHRHARTHPPRQRSIYCGCSGRRGSDSAPCPRFSPGTAMISGNVSSAATLASHIFCHPYSRRSMPRLSPSFRPPAASPLTQNVPPTPLLPHQRTVPSRSSGGSGCSGGRAPSQ